MIMKKNYTNNNEEIPLNSLIFIIILIFILVKW
jgi:hypothetical protein